jgi:hypothetical protein
LILAERSASICFTPLRTPTAEAVRGKEQIVKRDRTLKKRQKLARYVERAAVPERPFIGRGPRYLVQPSVTAACAPSLRAIAAALRDETHRIDDASLEAVQTWLRGRGPFLGRDSLAALHEVVRLEQLIVGERATVADPGRVPVAA